MQRRVRFIALLTQCFVFMLVAPLFVSTIAARSNGGISFVVVVVVGGGGGGVGLVLKFSSRL